MEKSGLLCNFMQQCVQLYDISPLIACKIVYGSWSFNHPDYGLREVEFAEFTANDYSRYSLEARKEVVSAMIKCGHKYELMNDCFGLIANSEFLNELNLWRKWGMDYDFIRYELDNYIYSIVHDDFWYKFCVLSAMADKVSPQAVCSWWKKEGPDEELSAYIGSKLHSYFEYQFKAFSVTMNYINKQLTEEEAFDWMASIRKKYRYQEKLYYDFINCISQHII